MKVDDVLLKAFEVAVSGDVDAAHALCKVAETMSLCGLSELSVPSEDDSNDEG